MAFNQLKAQGISVKRSQVKSNQISLFIKHFYIKKRKKCSSTLREKRENERMMQQVSDTPSLSARGPMLPAFKTDKTNPDQTATSPAATRYENVIVCLHKSGPGMNLPPINSS